MSVEWLPGSSVLDERIERDTARDVAESFVGGVPVSLPLLVENSMLDIADPPLGRSLAYRSGSPGTSAVPA